MPRSPSSVLDRVDAATLARGRRYHAEGRVLDIDGPGPDGLVEAGVEGSGDAVYDLMALCETDDHTGAPRLLRGACSCPVGTDCKHLVALALALAERAPRRGRARPGMAAPPSATATTTRPAAKPAATPGLAPDLARWLDTLRRAEAAARDDAAPFPATVRDRLVPVIGVRIPDGAVMLEVLKIRLDRDDQPTGRPQRYQPYALHRSGPRPKFLRPPDVALLQRLDAAVTTLPPGLPGLATLHAALATGRARWRSPEGPLLRSGPTRQGRFVWEAGGGTDRDADAATAGLQRLVLRETGDDPATPGRALDALPLAPPWYVDPDTGETGPVETGHPPGVARLLALAPPAPAESVEAIAEALASLDAQSAPQTANPAPPRHRTKHGGEDALTPPQRPVRATLPRPAAVDVRHVRDTVPAPVLHLTTALVRLPDIAPVALPVLAPRFAYGPAGETAPHGPDPLRHRDGATLVLTRRDQTAEANALDRLSEQAMELDFVAVDDLEGSLPRVPERDPADLVLLPAWLDDWLAGDRPDGTEPDWRAEVDTAALETMTELRAALEAEGWRIAIADDWPWRLYDGPVAFSAGASMLTEDTDWFALAMTLEADGQTLDLLPVLISIIAHLPLGPDGRVQDGLDLAAFLSGLPLFPELPDGSRVRLDGERLAPIVQAVLEAQGLAEGRFHAAEAGRALRLAEALAGCGVPWRGDPRLIDLGERLRALAEVGPAEPPEGLTAELRPYQRTGYAWLSALAETGFGAVLADEMGLGKTVQTLALLVHRHLEIGQDRPSLLVVPTSLVPTWTREAERFAPGLRLLVLHGPDRHDRMDEIADAHVVLTTYPLLHRDIDRLAGQPFDLAVLDEAQAVKNPAAAVAGHIRRLDARTRLALTGTPVENALLDLWALFDWLIPGLLGHRAGFTRVFRTPIERHGDPRARATLAARVAPFVLRRTKASVAAELPARTEIDEPVTLQGGQRALYESLRVAMDARVRRAIAEKGVEGSRITILDALLKLRQAACDPALVKLAAARTVTESAKRTRLMALLDAVLAEGRQVLVFSQFVAFLRLVEADLDTRGWPYAKLTGQTRDRDGAVARFQSGEASVFLISLKAGGTGLTLTAADTVVLLDPWWNPAAERQAMDRAHRIGQDKPVFVHRLIAEGTVETAIRGLQARKQALAAGVFGEGDQRLPTAFDETDIARLFAPIG